LPDAQFLVWTIPDVTLSPKLSYLTQEEAESVRAHIERVNLYISGLVEERRVLVFDLYAVMQQLVADPPVVGGQRLVGPPTYGHDNDLFADKIHPTAVSNALIANEMIKRINDSFEDNISLYTKRELASLARSRWR
jgi:phospholipase/lecithinase/hemolysin